MRPPRVYWDANVVLSYLNAVPERLAVIEELLRRARAKDIEIVTSALSITEVAFAQGEKDGAQLDARVEQDIDELWAPGSPIATVEFYDLIAYGARGLVRQGLPQGWGFLKPLDAIHVATAQHFAVSEFHTYDKKILRWNGHLAFSVTEPQTAQGILGTGA
jgi:predicted nucleic acid-binding protein